MSCDCETVGGVPPGGQEAVNQLDWKASTRVATTGALPANTLTGDTLTADANGALPAQDGVALGLNDSILVKDEGGGTSPKNGIYIVVDLGSAGTPWVLRRRGDANTDAEVTAGMTTYIEEGAVNGTLIFTLVTPDPITLGVTALTFAPLSSLTVCAALPTTSDAGPALVGGAADAARCDHKHTIATAAPGATSVGTVPAVGVATTLARSDHVHQSNTAPANVDKSAAAIGVSGEPARADHKHDVDTAAPGVAGVGTVSAEGVATTLARSDHVHQSNTAPANVDKSAAVIGVSGEPARADHKHDVDTATPVDIGTANAEGVAATLARSDHVHDHANQPGGSLHAVATIAIAGFMSAADKAKLDGIAAQATPAVIQFGAGSIATSTTVRYLFPAYDDDTAEVAPALQFRIPFAGTLQNLRVHTDTPGVDGGATITYTVLVNGVGTALAATMGVAANDGSDLANSVAVVAGDLIGVEVTKSAAITTTPFDIFASMELVA